MEETHKKEDPRQKEWGEQIKENGFADYKLWNLDITMIELLYERIQRFLEVSGVDAEISTIWWNSQDYTTSNFLWMIAKKAEYVLKNAYEPQKAKKVKKYQEIWQMWSRIRPWWWKHLHSTTSSVVRGFWTLKRNSPRRKDCSVWRKIRNLLSKQFRTVLRRFLKVAEEERFFLPLPEILFLGFPRRPSFFLGGKKNVFLALFLCCLPKIFNQFLALLKKSSKMCSRMSLCFGNFPEKWLSAKL